jgi:hypothetical protein
MRQSQIRKNHRAAHARTRHEREEMVLDADPRDPDVADPRDPDIVRVNLAKRGRARRA